MILCSKLKTSYKENKTIKKYPKTMPKKIPRMIESFENEMNICARDKIDARPRKTISDFT